MAIERNLCGFETGDQSELLYGGSGSIAAIYRDVVTSATGQVRSGTYALKLAPGNGIASQVQFPAGAVVGTTGTVTTGNHERFRARAFFRLTALTVSFGNQSQRLLGLGTDNGYANINNGSTTLANTGIGAWIHPDGRFFIHVPPGGFGAPASTFSVGTIALNRWYQLILDVDYAVAANTVVTASARIINDGGAAFNETVTATNSIGATDAMRVFSFGSGFTGAFPPSYTIYWDDVLWTATSGVDAVSAITLPTEDVITGFVPSGTSVNAWTGAVTAVDERPVDTSSSFGDTISSSLGTGTTVTFTHPTAAALGIGGLRAWKLYVNAATIAAGTGRLDVVLNGLTQAMTYTGAYPAVDGVANPVAGLQWGDVTRSAFNAATFGVVKQNGTQTSHLGNLVAEVLGAAIPDPVVITTTVLANLVATVPTNQTITATGGSVPYVFTLASGTLPPGLSLSPAGVLSGTPPSAAVFGPDPLPPAHVDVSYTAAQLAVAGSTTSYPFTVRVTDLFAQFDDQDYTVALLSWVGPTVFEIVGARLPSCLRLTADGRIQGIPMRVGAFTFTARATSATGQVMTRVFTITVTS